MVGLKLGLKDGKKLGLFWAWTVSVAKPKMLGFTSSELNQIGVMGSPFHPLLMDHMILTKLRFEIWGEK